MRVFENKNINLLIFAFFYAVLIGIELSYRQPLFDKSLGWIENLSHHRADWITSFFKFLTMFGTAGIIVPLYGLILNLCTLQVSFAFLLNYCAAAYIDNILKLIYSNPRPFWVNQGIEMVICDGGYGNPSGHSYSSGAVYLSLWHIFCNNKKFMKKQWIKVPSLIFTILFIFSIMFTRFYFGVHALNQLIYGFSLGATQYIIIYQILQLDKYKASDFFNIFITLKTNIISWSIYIFSFLLMILIFNLKTFDHTYEPYLTKICGHLSTYRIFEYDGMTNCLNIFLLIGAHTGLTIVYFLLKRKFEDSLDLSLAADFACSSLKNFLLRLLLLLGMIIPFSIIIITIKDSVSFTIYSIFKLTVPYFFITVVIYSLGVYYSVSYNLLAKQSADNYLIVPEMEKGNEIRL